MASTGAVGCYAGGVLGDAWGRTRTTALAMAASGTCAALIGFTYGRSPLLVLAVGVVWGIAVIADSAQFSTMVTDLADQSYVGTALTTQMAIGSGRARPGRLAVGVHDPRPGTAPRCLGHARAAPAARGSAHRRRPWLTGSAGAPPCSHVGTTDPCFTGPMLLRGLVLLATLALLGCAVPGAGSPQATATVGTVATPTAAVTSAAPAAPALPTGAPATACKAPATPMVAMTEGPYYRADPPQRSVLYSPGIAGSRLILSGLVLTRSCVPIANARVDFWQADGNGVYDNTGYTLRGFQLTDGQGRYQLDTVVPGLYPGRTEHIHVKVTPPGGATTTSQLYFPTSSRNQSDGIFSGTMLVTLTPGTPLQGRFDFVANVP